MRTHQQGRVARFAAVGAVVVLVGVVWAPIAGAVAARPVLADRWMRAVCKNVSNWLEERADVDTRVAEILDGLATGDVKPKAAQARLKKAAAQGTEASGELIKDVKSAGTPKVDDGKSLATGYLATLGDYQDVFKTAQADFGREKTKDQAEFTAAVEEIEASRLGDLDVVGIDPIEELRAVTEFASAIDTQCGDIDSYLTDKIEPPCRTALDTAKRYIEASLQYQKSAPDSPEEAAASEQQVILLNQLVNEGELTACNIAGVLGPCRKPLETAQSLGETFGAFLASAEGSPEEAQQSDELDRLILALEDELRVC